jgi:anaerobic selenocysteine-containing dehydrogenase
MAMLYALCSMLYALTGSFDAAGGNVIFPAVPAGSITGENLPAAKGRAPAIGFAERPLEPARWNYVSPLDFYRAVLEDTPYPVRGLIGFGANVLLSNGDPVRGRAALAAIPFEPPVTSTVFALKFKFTINLAFFCLSITALSLSAAPTEERKPR